MSVSQPNDGNPTAATSGSDGNRTKRRSVVVFLLVASAAVAAALILNRIGSTPNAEIVAEGARVLEKGDYSAALAMAEEALENDSNDPAALLLAAQSAVGLEEFDAALEFLDRIGDDGNSRAVEARILSGELLLMQFQRLSAAEDQYRRTLTQDETNPLAHERLAYLLGLQGRRWEAIPHRLALIRAGQASPLHLYLLSVDLDSIENPEEIEQYADAAAADPGPRLALARIATGAGNYDRAEELLQQALKLRPDLAEANVRLGETLLASGKNSAFAVWSRELPQAVLDHPVAWVVYGHWAERTGQKEVEARCLWEAVRRNPNDRRSMYRLGRVLVELNRADDAEVFLDRARRLEAYAKAAEVAYHVGTDDHLQDAASLADDCGLLWESSGWSQVALDQDPLSTWARERAERLRANSAELALSRAVPESNPTRKIDLTDLPLPTLNSAPDDAPTADRADPETAVDGNLVIVTFADRAAECGMNFQYENGGQPRTHGIVRMYEVVGGGVAVLDFDHDGWPDVYFAQGGEWSGESRRNPHSDRLFRSRGDQRFDDVTQHAGVAEERFSQGAAVGDVNNDGFPDLFIANIGPNRLLMNNGDGTFSDAAEHVPGDSAQYSTSAVVADLNGDANPDVYVVNYLAGSDLFTKTCGDPQRPRSCLPHEFAAAEDHLLLNLGTGEFEDVTSDAGVDAGGGKGLGVVAADFHGEGSLSLFVANDVSPNFLYVNRTADSGGRLAFQERGLSSGVALNGNGRQESSMGVAAGDVDGDGRVDLFVTNFDNETNTLYLQTDKMLFVDATARSGLADKPLPLLGWGTQFLDADLDGWLDLLLTNGHINDLRDHGKPYQMPPQFFRNQGGGRFTEHAAESLGPFFSQWRLGRGMARIDWNRDGLDDAVISHLDAPAALLTNTSAETGRALAVRLVGVHSSRDAIGATLTARVGTRTLVRQLTAGDGNQCSNERRLIFGLGEAADVDRLEVRWPSGRRQQFAHLLAGTDITLVEGRNQPVLIRHTEP